MSHRPRKRWGQHFLHDRHAIARIIAAIAPAPDDHICEIGPGEGVLTRPLVAAAGRVDAIEIDRDLAAALSADSAEEGTLQVHVGDALTFDPAAIAGERPLRVVGNLPYNISTPLLFHLLEHIEHIADMHFMLQREVVERMAAAAGDPGRGRLALMVQALCRVEPLFRLAPGAFRPPPQVDSAVVRLTPHAEPAVTGTRAQAYAELVQRAFSARRKTLRRSLAPRLDAATIAACGIDPGLRPERLRVADFAALAAAATPE